MITMKDLEDLEGVIQSLNSVYTLTTVTYAQAIRLMNARLPGYLCTVEWRRYVWTSHTMYVERLMA